MIYTTSSKKGLINLYIVTKGLVIIGGLVRIQRGIAAGRGAKFEPKKNSKDKKE